VSAHVSAHQEYWAQRTLHLDKKTSRWSGTAWHDMGLHDTKYETLAIQLSAIYNTQLRRREANRDVWFMDIGNFTRVQFTVKVGPRKDPLQEYDEATDGVDIESQLLL